MAKVAKQLPTILMAALLAAVLFATFSATKAEATHEPADKAVAAGSDVDQIEDDTPILSETMRVSSTSDLILQLTAECSILTELSTGGEGVTTDTQSAFGSVRLWVEIDGNRVPVATDDTPVDAEENAEDDAEDDATLPGDAPAGLDDTDTNDESDIGEVTFCNRAYSRTVEDSEEDGDIDQQDDYIRTRTANAFNWLALDAGKDYDTDGNNLLNVVVWADYDARETEKAVADAFVGSRTLIIEPTHASVHEQVSPLTNTGS